MDFNAIRARTLGSGRDEEAVTVNTRALIDKVLARYSGEWTVLRELLQNAADAAASRVTIKFETLPSSTQPVPQTATPSSLLKHTLQHHTLKRLIVSNNGQTFNENDWSRLKRIAEGNPDETKIGAFGVGFYSVFADCEEPFISSGSEAMAFYWKSNALFTRRLHLTEKESSKDTNFVLDYRDITSPVPPLLPLAQFLASSLTFVGIESVELFLDDWNILRLSKKTSPSQEVVIPQEIGTKTSERLMQITKVVREVSQIDGEWMDAIIWRRPQVAGSLSHERDNAPSFRKFFSRLAGNASADEPKAPQSDSQVAGEDLSHKSTANVFLNVNTATIKTYPKQSFAQELERATKKPPPKFTHLAVLTAPYIDKDANSASAADVFATVLPTKSGRIFIGFPTHQTTGLAAHISAPSVIPTVERESIDLNARYVKTWNFEMLRAAGILCRIAWTSEIAELKDRVLRSADDKKKIRIDNEHPLLPAAITTTKTFTFRESTPSAQTGQILEDAFWTCSQKASIEVMSSAGVLPTHEVRIAPKDLSFMEGVPIIPERMTTEAKGFVEKLIDFGLLTDVTVSDMTQALEAVPLNATQVSEFLAWMVKQRSQALYDFDTVRRLLAVAVVHEGSADGSSGSVIALSTVEHFITANKIPADLPLPPTTMPFRYTKSLSKKELESVGWEELQLVPWTKWLIEEAEKGRLPPSQNIAAEPLFSAQVLPIMSKGWEGLSQSSKATLVNILSTKSVIPTKLGMKKPGEAYFPTVKLFDDLPTITGLANVKDKFLQALGVRKTVELGVVFDRLLSGNISSTKPETNGKNQTSHVELIQYLVSVRDDIPSADIQRLKNTPICPKESRGEKQTQDQKRYKVSELFEPRPVFRELGLPTVSWPGLYRGGSPEGRFLGLLGLRNTPSVPELIEIMAKAGAQGDGGLRDRAMTYFLSNHHSNGYSSFDYTQVSLPFLPLEKESKRTSTPVKCFVDEGASLLGFDILKRELHPHATKFGVRTNPPMEQCINLLSQKPPSTNREARAIFAYFAGRLNEINTSNIPHLSALNFIPIFGKVAEKGTKPRYASPQSCFLGDSDAFAEIFNYVDFGQEANAFLLKCGSKLEPTKVEVAQILVKEPARISATFGNAEKYMTLLRSLADSMPVLKKNKDLFREMKRATFLLASKELPVTQANDQKHLSKNFDEAEEFDEDDTQGIREWQLTSAAEAIIIDDYTNYTLFKTNILAAPQEESLEEFYFALGSPLLSTLVEEAARHGPRAPDQKPAQKLQKQIYERTQLFLHDQPTEAIKHDTKWLEKNLQVQLVSSISLRRSLKDRNVSMVEKRSAVVTQANREYTLWIMGERPDLYQVSQALVHLLLNRPKLHSALTLEMLLKTELLDLRARGFNVGRILRQKAAEARLAESRRQQELEAEQNRIEEQQKAWKTSQELSVKEKGQRQQLPGDFPDSPDRGAGLRGNLTDAGTAVQRQPRNILSSISRQLGLGDRSSPLQNLLGNASDGTSHSPVASSSEAEPPPPYTQSGPQSTKSQGHQVTAPHQLRENLLNAVKKARAHNSNDVFSRGETNVVNETTSYCDERPAHDLGFVAEIKHGIQMFLSPSTVHNSSDFLAQHSTGLTLFAGLLRDVAAIFPLAPRTVNVFFEPEGKTIAFNRNGSIFCNYLYYQQLHEQAMNQGQGVWDALVYWWVIFCHELAHNLVADHSSNHSYYTEGFIAQYFGKVVTALGDRVKPPVAASGSAPLVDV